MGVYNTVTTELICPNCQLKQLFEVQFFYGAVRLYNYAIGDDIVWGGPLRKYEFSRAEREKLDAALIGGDDVGSPEFEKVVVDAVAAECPNCGSPGPECEVYIENSKIVDAQIASGNYRFTSPEEPYVVIDGEKSKGLE